RRIGTVDLIASTDVTSRTLGSTMLEAFVLRRSNDQFLHSEGEADALLKRSRSAIEGDVRYSVNAYYCYEAIWHVVFKSLADTPNVVVLMDVRGFTAEHTSCAWELGYLLRYKTLDKILLIADGQTDEEALDDVFRKAP